MEQSKHNNNLENNSNINITSSKNIDKLLSIIISQTNNILDINLKLENLIHLSGLSYKDIKMSLDENGNEIYTLSEEGFQKIDKIIKFYIIEENLKKILNEEVKLNIQNAVNHFNKSNYKINRPNLTVEDLLKKSKEELLKQFYSQKEKLEKVFSSSVERAIEKERTKISEVNNLLEKINISTFEKDLNKKEFKTPKINNLIESIINNDIPYIDSIKVENKKEIEENIPKKTKVKKKQDINTQEPQSTIEHKYLNSKNGIIMALIVTIGIFTTYLRQNTPELNNDYLNEKYTEVLTGKTLDSIPREEMTLFLRMIINKYESGITKELLNIPSNKIPLKTNFLTLEGNKQNIINEMVIEIVKFLLSKGIPVNDITIDIKKRNGELSLRIIDTNSRAVDINIKP